MPGFDANPGEEPEDDEITISASALRSLGDQMQRFLLEYRFAMQEVETKLAILREEFLHMHEYNPIEHVSSCVKSVDSLVAKLERRGIGTDFDHGAGVDGFDSEAEAPNVTRELLRRGYSEEQIAAIWGGNFLRVLNSAEQGRKS